MRKIALVRKNPERAARLCRTTLTRAENSCNAVKYENACTGYELAKRLRSSRDRWNRFKGLSFWEGYRRDMHVGDVLRFSLMYVYGDRESRMAEVARDHARRLKEAWIAKKPTTAVFDELLANGFVGAAVTDRQTIKTKVSRDASRRTFLVKERPAKVLDDAKAGQSINLRLRVMEESSGPRLVVTRARIVDEDAAPEPPRLKRMRRRPRCGSPA